MTVPAATGYPQYSGSLIQPHFYPRFLMRSYAETLMKDITTTAYTGQLRQFGDQITFQREPVARIHRYQKNIRLQTDTPEIDTTTLTVDEGFYWNYKLDRVDVKQIRNAEELQNVLISSGGRSVGYAQEKAILAKMIRDAASYNKGINAGLISRNVNLGAVGNPLQITGGNFLEFFARCNQVLAESNVWEAGEMFMILPPASTAALFTSPLSNAFVTGLPRSFIVDSSGKPLRNIDPAGFRLLGSNFVPTVYDTTANAQCSFVIFGRRMATGYVQQLSDADTIKSEHFFGTYFRGLTIFGHKPLFPEQLGVAYVRFN
jgi:hypothetical protein